MNNHKTPTVEDAPEPRTGGESGAAVCSAISIGLRDTVNIPCRGGHNLTGKDIVEVIHALVEISEAAKWGWTVKGIMDYAQEQLDAIGWPNAELCQPCPPSTPPRQETADGQGLA